MALTIGSLLSAGPASAQLPAPYAEAPTTMPAMATMPGMATSPSSDLTAPVNHAAPTDPRIVRTHANFDPYATYDEIRSRANERPLWETPSEKPSDFYSGSGCADGKCGKNKDGHGLHGGGGLGGRDDGKDTGTGPDFDCANCWRGLNFEHKIFADYHYLYPLRTATKVGYGIGNGATLGVEWLPWVARDDANHFSRWGWITAFDYTNWRGNRDTILVSEFSGNVLSSAGGNTFGMLLGPAYRTDFYFFGKIRVSPSISAGLDLNWTTMREAEPSVFPPAPIIRPDPQPTFTEANGALVRSVQKFKFTDFCWGPYGRVVFDFPIRQKLNLGIGMDLRISKTEMFVKNDEARKHFGLILQIAGEF